MKGQAWIKLAQSVALPLDLSCSTLALPGKFDHSTSQLIQSYCCPAIKWPKHLTSCRQAGTVSAYERLLGIRQCGKTSLAGHCPCALLADSEEHGLI
jgi:hypothetical protein